MKINPLFDPNQNQYTVFTPDTDPRLVKFCNTAKAGLWQAGDINFSFDKEQWETKLKPEEQDYIKQILAFFASSDGLVNENIVLSFVTQVKIPEVKFYYYYQMMQEAVHSETYSNLITTFIKNTKEQKLLFDSLNNHPIIKKKGDWCRKWMKHSLHSKLDTKQFFESMVAFLAVEGIFFSSSFASIFWLRDRGILANSLGVANEYISLEEGAHANFASFLIKTYGQDDVSSEAIINIITEATEIECEFVDYILPDKLLGMNKELMKQYVKYVADIWTKELTGQVIYQATNPFDFMKTIGQSGKDNFFEKTRTNYSHKTAQGDNANDYDLDLED